MLKHTHKNVLKLKLTLAMAVGLGLWMGWGCSDRNIDEALARLGYERGVSNAIEPDDLPNRPPNDSTGTKPDTTGTGTNNEKIYKVTIIGGRYDFYGSGDYKANEEVNIYAGSVVTEDSVFSYWTSEPYVTFADSSNQTTKFIMPERDVKVTAHFAIYEADSAFVPFIVNVASAKITAKRVGNDADVREIFVGAEEQTILSLPFLGMGQPTMTEDWNITVNAYVYGHIDTEYTLSVVKGINPVQDITLRIDYNLVSGDASCYLADAEMFCQWNSIGCYQLTKTYSMGITAVGDQCEPQGNGFSIECSCADVIRNCENGGSLYAGINAKALSEDNEWGGKVTCEQLSGKFISKYPQWGGQGVKGD